MFDNVHFSRFLNYIPPSPASPASGSLSSIFPELSPLIHNRRLPSTGSTEGLSGGANNRDIAVIDNDDSGSSAAHEAFDYGDEDDSDHHTTNVSIYGPNESHLVINSLGSQSAGGLDGENTHLQNDSILAGPDLYTPSTRSSSPALSYVDPDTATQFSLFGNNLLLIPHNTLDPTNILMEQDRSSIISRPSTAATEPLIQDFLDGFQLESSLSRSPDDTQTMVNTWQILEDREALEPPTSEPATRDTYSDINEEPNGQTYEAPQSSNSSKEEPDDAVREVDSPRYSNTGSRDRRDSFTSDETHEFFESCQSSPQSSFSSTLPLESRRSTPVPGDRCDPKSDETPQSDLEYLHDINDSDSDSDSNEQYNVDTATFTLPVDIIPVTPPDSPIFDGLSQYMIPGVVDSGVNSTPSPSRGPSTATPEDENSQSNPERLHVIDDSNEQYNVDTNIPSAIILPVDIIPVSPPGSPIFEGLTQYMIPGAALQVNQDNVSAPVQRDIPSGERTPQPSSEAPHFGLPPSNGNEQSPRSAQQATNPPESPEPSSDAVQPDPPYPHHLSHVQVRDSQLGMSTSPFERIQFGRLRLMPTFFALSGETIHRTT